MRKLHSYRWMGVMFLSFVLPMLAQQSASELAEGKAPAETNFNAVAILRWYPANLRTTFSAGTNPVGVAFDGANIWVANFSSNNVTKLQASDGKVIGSFSVGTNPNDMAFDGANIWVSNFSSNNVAKLRASDGSMLGTFNAGSAPVGISFDGANIWVTSFNSNTVSKL
jgi:outer membrane protein assembly factor BamB